MLDKAQLNLVRSAIKTPNFQSMMYIIARYNEDVSWSDSLENKFIVQKDVHLPNEGREASSYLWYIINFYDTLEGVYGFRQGKVMDHPVNDFSLEGGLDPNKPGYNWSLDLRQAARELELEIPDRIVFTPGAQFDVKAEQIKLRSKQWYENAYRFTLKDHTKGPWVMERLWKYIFNL